MANQFKLNTFVSQGATGKNMVSRRTRACFREIYDTILPAHRSVVPRSPAPLFFRKSCSSIRFRSLVFRPTPFPQSGYNQQNDTGTRVCRVTRHITHCQGILIEPLRVDYALLYFLALYVSYTLYAFYTSHLHDTL
jgi:hypothetical protein